MSRTILRGIGPEEAEQLIPASTAVACSCKDSEQSKPAAVMPVFAEYRVVFRSDEAKCAKRPKVESG